MLEVSSPEIIFDLKNDIYIPYSLSLKNVTSYYLAYKIKSTKPELFSVKQSRGLISPQQSEIVEFSTTDRAKEEFRSKTYRESKILNICYQCLRKEISKTNNIVRLLKLTTSSKLKLVLVLDCLQVYQRKNLAKKFKFKETTWHPVMHLFQYTNQLKSYQSNSRSESQATMQSMIQPTPLTNQVQCVQRLKQIELELAEEKRKREQMYNTIEISKLKKGSSFLKFILPIILGILLSNVYQMSLKYYE